MRQITVKVPSGELADLERITLVESRQRKPQIKTDKRRRGKLSGSQRVKIVKFQRAAASGAFEHNEPVPVVEQPLIAHPTMKHALGSSLRAQRSAALSKVFGILKGRDDAPQDGLQFQLEMRAE